MARWFKKNINAGLVQQPGKNRLTLGEIALTGGSLKIRDVSASLWFPPGQPVPPVAPKGTAPRRYAFQPLTNYNFSSRDGGVDFWTLRRFSNYTICRAIIESVLDRLCSETWEYRLIRDPSEKTKDYKKRNANDPRLDKLRQLFRKPDGWQTHRTWLRGLYDDMLVGDNASVWLQKDDSGKIASLVQIDGAQVFPLIDETGQQPSPDGRALVQTGNKKAVKSYLDKVKAKGGKISGTDKKGDMSVSGGSPAFQLTPYGFPAQEMTADELVYAVRNRKTYRRYGFSIVEQSLAMIALGLARQDFQAAYYASGNVPEFIAFLPPDVPVTRAEELNGYLDSVLSGQSRNRRKGFFLPSYGSEKAPNIIFPKANDEVLKDTFDEWIARVMCYFFGMSPTAFIKQVNRATAESSAQESEEQGLQPYLDWAVDLHNEIIQDRLGWDDIEAVTGTRKEQDATKQAEIDKIHVSTGIKTLDEVREQNGDDGFGTPETKAPVVITATGIVPWDGSPLSNAPPAPPMVGPDGKPMPPAGGKTPPGGGGKTPPKKPKGPAAKKEDSRHAWPTLSPGILTATSHAARVRLETALLRCFKESRDAAIRGVNGLIARPAKKMKKDDETEKDEIAKMLAAAVKQYFDRIPIEAQQPLEDAGESGVTQAVLDLSIDSSDLISDVNQQAADYASERAAEMVGMSRDAEGNLIPNPNAQWNIADTTRDELRRIVTNAFEGETDFDSIISKIKVAIQNENVFSDSRAEMIARTEIGHAQMGSSMKVWKKSGLVTKLKWEAVGPDPCPLCLMNSGVTVDFGKAFPSGYHSTLDSHPRCNCLVYAVEFVDLNTDQPEPV